MVSTFTDLILRVILAYVFRYINGMEDGRFAPKENLTRAQAAVVMNNLK